MTKLRRPKNLDQYSTAVDAAAGLEKLAAELRAGAAAYPLVRWNINVSFWNPAWEQDPAPTPTTPRKVGAKATS